MINYHCTTFAAIDNKDYHHNLEGKTSKSTELDILTEYTCKCDAIYFDTFTVVWKKDIKYTYKIQLWDLGDWGHFVAFFYLQTKKRLKGKTIYDVELDQLYNKIQVINFLNQMIKDVNCYEQWIRFNTFENYGMYKLFITQLSQSQLMSFLSCLTSFHILWLKC